MCNHNDRTKHGPYIPQFDSRQDVARFTCHERKLYNEFNDYGKKPFSILEVRQYRLARARRDCERERLEKLYPRAMQYQLKETARIAIDTLDICMQKSFPNVQVLPDALKCEILKFTMPILSPIVSFRMDGFGTVDDGSKFMFLNANVMRKLENESTSLIVVNKDNVWKIMGTHNPNANSIMTTDNRIINPLKIMAVRYSVDEAASIMCTKMTDHFLRECHVTRKIRFEISIRYYLHNQPTKWQWAIKYRDESEPELGGVFKEDIPERYSGNFLSVLETVEEKLEQYAYLVDRVAINENISSKPDWLHSTFEIDVYYEP